MTRVVNDYCSPIAIERAERDNMALRRHRIGRETRE